MEVQAEALLSSSGPDKKVIEESFNGVVVPKSPPSVLQDVTFHVNNMKYTVTNPDPNTSLNEWIRNQPGLKGTKVMCKEAGCGCCVVAVTRNDPKTGVAATKAVNSCLCPLYSINGCEVKTTEGIGNRKEGFNEIQKRIAEHNGSQCGFCTPGMVMNMYSLLKENPKPTKELIESSFDGNICRCTGYRPILDAMKSFSVDSSPIDIEELNKCTGKCDNCLCKKQGAVQSNTAGIKWYSVKSLAELYTLLDLHSNDQLRMVAGNTGKGIYKKHGPVNVYIDINDVPELHSHVDVDGYLVVGGGVSLTSLIQLCEERTAKSPVFPAIAEHLKVVANTPVRNVGTIAGNMMLAHDHPDFPSDIMTIMEGIGASVIIGQSTAREHSSGVGASLSQLSLQEFIQLNMKGKVLVALAIPKLPNNVVVRTYKITPRSQNAHAYVNASITMAVNKDDMIITAKPRIVYGGIRHNFLHASKTEEFLLNKTLSNPETLKGALDLLDSEIIPDPDFISHNGSTVEYHKNLTQSLFYKFYVAALGDQASPRIRSAAEKILHQRPVSSGQQSYDTKPDMYPITKPMTKIAAKLQASGEAQFTNDIPTLEGEVYAAFVVSTLGNCKLGKIDTSEAMKMPGVIRFFGAADIPPEGENYMGFFNAAGPKEGVFCEKDVLYTGHALGIIIADTQRHADEAAEHVRVEYTDIKPPILSIADAIEAKSFAQLPFFIPKNMNVGDFEGAVNSSRVVTGEVSCGAQHHFHMETQVAFSIPEESGLTVYSASQGPSFILEGISRALGIPSKDIDVITRRSGGSFGGKGLRSIQIAIASALAAKALDRPVRLKMNFNTNLTSVGGRSPHMARYKVAFNDEGLLQGVELDYYEDTGCSAEDADIMGAVGHWDNLYYCPNWKINQTVCLTNKASSTFCRAPGSVQAVFIMESIMEHVAKELNKTPEEIRQINLYQDGQLTPVGKPIPNCEIRRIWAELQESSEFVKRKDAVNEFNKSHRWRKRGLAMCPGKFNLEFSHGHYTVLVAIYKQDGSVAITHGGTEMGQGINVKAAQTAAYTLGIPMDLITIKQQNTHAVPNSGISGGSISSEMCCEGVMECCKILNERLAPLKEQLKDAPWKQIIKTAGFKKVDLSVKYWMTAGKNSDYTAYGVTCAEAEVDILTGERQIVRCDILHDCGESMNPEIDVGQVEGAFVMGMGYWLQEKIYFDQNTGKELSTGTWTYKPPTTKDIPVDFRVTLLKNVPNPRGFMRAKAIGEPPITMSCVCLFAVKHAVEEARKELGKDQYFTLNGPATVEETQLHCLVNRDQMTL